MAVDLAQERSKLIFDLRNATLIQSGTHEGLIGELIERPAWKMNISFAPWQADIILKLDNIIRQAKEDSYSRDADYVEAEHEDYFRHVENGNERRWSLRYHGQEVVQLGILEGPQVAFVMHACFSRFTTFAALNDQLVQQDLRFTKAQLADLNKLRRGMVLRKSQLNLMARDPAEQKANHDALKDIEKHVNNAALKILTPEQLALWDELIRTKPVPDVPAEIPDLETKKIQLMNCPLLFDYLDKNADLFKLTNRQEEQLRNMEDVVRSGLAAIQHRESSLSELERQSRTTVRDFISHAQEIVLIGILSQEQEQVARKALSLPRDTGEVQPVGDPV